MQNVSEQHTTSIHLVFNELKDTRGYDVIHLLNNINIISMTLCTIISECEIVESISMHAKARNGFLKCFLDLSSGIPSAGMFHDILNKINPTKFITCFNQWIKTLKIKCYELITIKGKTLIGTADKTNHPRNAWSVENQIYFGQLTVSDKSDDISAIPALSKTLDIKGSSKKKLIIENFLNAIIYIQDNLSPITSIPVSILTFNRSREKDLTNKNHKDVFPLDTSQYYQQDKTKNPRLMKVWR